MTTDPFDTQATEKARHDHQVRQRLTLRQEADDIKWLMSDKRGRRIMWGLLERAGVHRVGFDSNPYVTAFNQGSRNIGLMYEALIHEHCAERIQNMITEKRDHDRKFTDRDRQHAG